MGNAQARQTVERFMQSVNGQNLDAVMELIADDVRFENTGPAPDGERYEGKAAMKTFWEQFFANSPTARFELEDIIEAGDRVVATHQYHWSGNGTANDPGRVRGVTIFTIRDGRIAGMYPYVKG